MLPNHFIFSLIKLKNLIPAMITTNLFNVFLYVCRYRALCFTHIVITDTSILGNKIVFYCNLQLSGHFIIEMYHSLSHILWLAITKCRTFIISFFVIFELTQVIESCSHGTCCPTIQRKQCSFLGHCSMKHTRYFPAFSFSIFSSIITFCFRIMVQRYKKDLK